jgi:predicted nucleotidyltransferase
VSCRLFGSALRDDFGPNSDIDLLVTFSLQAQWSLFDHMAMEEELTEMLGRKVDLVSRRGLERSQNWIRRRGILQSAQRVYGTR